MTILDLAPMQVWKDLSDKLQKKTGLSCNVTDADNKPLFLPEKWANQLCPAVKGHPEAASAICAIAMNSMANEARISKKPVVEPCDLNLVKIAIPVFKDGLFLGAVGGCGGWIKGDEELEPLPAARLLGEDEEKIARMAEGAPVLEEKEIAGALKMVRRALHEIGADTEAQS